MILDKKIVADDRIPFLRGVLEPYFKDVLYLPGGKTTAADVADASIIITRTRTKCNESILAGSQVELIVSATIGFDHIDTCYLDATGIKWSNAPGCNSGSVRQYITAALLHLAQKHDFSLYGRTLGVIGVGNVGSKVAAAASALGMNVLLNDPPRAEREGEAAFTDLEELLSKSDIVTLHVPLENAGEYPTFHLADESFFNLMRQGAFFINSSRGEVCDTASAKAALKSGKLAGVVFDVWENEPEIDRELLQLADIGTPHIAGYSTNGKANGTAQCVNLIGRHFGIKELAEWYPADVPIPDEPVLIVPESGSFEDKMATLVASTYDITRDNDDLRRDVTKFEELRGSYYQRLEFSSYLIAAENRTEDITFAASRLGFMLEQVE